MPITSEKHHGYTNPNINGKLAANHNNNNNNNNDDLFTEDEIEVSSILFDLPYLMTKSLSYIRFNVNWKTKKRRSAVVSPPSPPPPRKVAPPPPPLKSSAQEASSPTTPLYFSESDSDNKYKIFLPKKRKSQGLNSRKEELEEALEERISTQQTLKDSIEKVKLYLNQLMVENSELKVKKQKLLYVNLGDEREKIMTACTPQMQPLLERQITPVNDLLQTGAPTSTENHHQIPLTLVCQQVNDPVFAVASTSTQVPHHYGPLISHQQHQQYAIMVQNNQADHHDLAFCNLRQKYQFDLNMVPEDDYKALAAVARQKRIHANKEKKTRVQL